MDRRVFRAAADAERGSRVVIAARRHPSHFLWRRRRRGGWRL